ncbi:hypothetical protein Dsin_017144 [Dipteronia sinensis]|uniref:Biotin carboxyl carrier protein of acetyl-CoA carboxylase n=1 Tax=Dipteronia sinensis TaxID=43782 RepID=A0AAE0E7L8_9ROSI|nr:hypothetical protein Dsin_017144 [Dipteronia sinensis]
MVSISVPCPKISLVAGAGSTRDHPQQMRMISLPNPIPSLSSGFLCPSKKQSALWNWKVHAKVNEVVALVDTESKVASSNGKVGSAESTIPDASSISAFMTQVSEIVKLVDSRDIMELQMKQMDCELIIRKKEALQQPAMPPSMPHAMYMSPPPMAPAAAPVPASPASAAPPALPAPAKTSQSSHPPLKCPMAGTFYRCPGPGEPPFVKVGDKVQKGQVICIIEAMKLMNEIEVCISSFVSLYVVIYFMIFHFDAHVTSSNPKSVTFLPVFANYLSLSYWILSNFKTTRS